MMADSAASRILREGRGSAMLPILQLRPYGFLHVIRQTPQLERSPALHRAGQQADVIRHPVVLPDGSPPVAPALTSVTGVVAPGDAGHGQDGTKNSSVVPAPPGLRDPGYPRRPQPCRVPCAKRCIPVGLPAGVKGDVMADDPRRGWPASIFRALVTEDDRAKPRLHYGQ